MLAYYSVSDIVMITFLFILVGIVPLALAAHYEYELKKEHEESEDL